MPESVVTKIVSHHIRKKFREIGLRAGKCAKLISSEHVYDAEFRYRSSSRYLMPEYRTQMLAGNKSTVVAKYATVDRVFFVSMNTTFQTPVMKNPLRWVRDILIVGLEGSIVTIQSLDELPLTHMVGLPSGLGFWLNQKINLGDPGSIERLTSELDRIFKGWLPKLESIGEGGSV